jgi:flagellar biogenesis protein FliO
MQESTRAMEGSAPSSRGTWHRDFWNALWAAVTASLGRISVKKKKRQLHIAETLQLGEKRYLTIVEWQGRKLLLGVTPHTIALLESDPAGVTPPPRDQVEATR